MYLSDRDIQWAIERKTLIVNVPEGVAPAKVDPSSIDLRLDHISEAKIWDIAAYTNHVAVSGDDEPVLHVGAQKYKIGSLTKFLVSPPERNPRDKNQKVYQSGGEVYIRPGGFLLWQTKEEVGTPKEDPRYICFVDGKSTRARTGLVVHMTAPNVHAGWRGNITLEIANLGPFTFGLREDDVIAQLVVAMISSSPAKSHNDVGSTTVGQEHVGGKDDLAT
jgi:deoxycytidine triphosphate deaminase